MTLNQWEIEKYSLLTKKGYAVIIRAFVDHARWSYMIRLGQTGMWSKTGTVTTLDEAQREVERWLK